MGIIKQAYEQLAAHREIVFIPEWDLTVYVAPVTVNQYKEIAAAEESKGATERNLAVIKYCAKDPEGDPAFSNNDIHEMRLYGSARVTARVANEILQAAERAEAYETEGEKKD